MNHNDQDFLVQKIRTQYTAPQHSELDELTALDRRVKAPAMALALTLGILAALLLGSGMSLIMTDIGQVVGLTSPLLPGLILGIAGLLLAGVNYPLYCRVLSRRRAAYAQRIIALSDRIISR